MRNECMVNLTLTGHIENKKDRAGSKTPTWPACVNGCLNQGWEEWQKDKEQEVGKIKLATIKYKALELTKSTLF